MGSLERDAGGGSAYSPLTVHVNVCDWWLFPYVSRAMGWHLV